jgi:hypothetical protein
MRFSPLHRRCVSDLEVVEPAVFAGDAGGLEAGGGFDDGEGRLQGKKYLSFFLTPWRCFD